DTSCPCARPSTAKDRPKSSLKSRKRLDEINQFCGSKSCLSTARSRKCKYEAKQERRPSSSSRGEISQKQQSETEESLGKLQAGEEEEARYAKFVYDITQEIVQNGLYTDRELKQVFEKHLERSSGRLNKRKMLYEIYQLKISLNMMDDSEEEDEVEADLVYAEKFASQRVPKPPTPPKVLNENKVIEKLQSFRELQENNVELYNNSAASSPRNKSVVLVDANPEFLVTERDVLSTLMDNHVEPEQIQRIYRKLFQRSKDMSLYEARRNFVQSTLLAVSQVQVGSEVAYAHRLRVDRSTSAASLSSAYHKERSHGILRKESTDFDAPRFGYPKNKQNEALEKCSRWRIEHRCDCKTQPCELEHEAEKSARKKDSSNRKINFTESDNSRRSGKEAKSSPETSARSSAAPGEKPDSARSEEPEEIEEDIESVIDELPDNKSPVADKSDHEEKELSSVQAASSDESLEYSDDFSNASENSKSPKGKVGNRRYSSIREYFERFATIDDQKIWRISEGSSSSSSSTSAVAPDYLQQSSAAGKVIKKRTSSGMSGFKVMDSWNERLSELSSDFYVNSAAGAKCDERCRRVSGKSCGDSCKFVRTDCRNLGRTSGCLNRLDEKPNRRGSDTSS
ncbi:hypothetical protein TSAR_008913, partial [Trichomalopsis sarcophagae]